MIRTVATTASTNADMLAHAAAGGAEGDWLRAVTQSGGRGRMGRAWVSPPGNLYATTLVRLRADDPAAATLALVAAIALHDALSEAAPDVAFLIKWPNDVLVGSAKLAGILIEREADAVVIGFGVNLASHPDGLARAVTSIASASGLVIDPAAMLERLAGHVSAWLRLWRRDPLALTCAAWEARAHPLGTQLATQSADGAAIEGRYEGLDASGALRLRLSDGAIHCVHAGDVFLV